MKIDKVLFVSNNNENYISFWPSISKHFKKYLKLEPKLFFLGTYTKENSKYLIEDYGEVEIFESLKEYPEIIQCLWGKFWFTQTELNTNWLIGDIDLYPLKKEYYIESLEKIPEGSYGHINANGYKAGNWYDNPKLGLPGYYHCAKGSKFKEFLSLSNSFESDIKYIYESRRYGAALNGLYSNRENIPERVRKAIPNSYEYICCEEHLSTERLISKRNEIHSFTYPSDSIRLESPIFYNEADHNSYIDIHCPRPYTKYGKSLEEVLHKYGDN